MGMLRCLALLWATTTPRQIFNFCKVSKLELMQRLYEGKVKFFFLYLNPLNCVNKCSENMVELPLKGYHLSNVQYIVSIMQPFSMQKNLDLHKIIQNFDLLHMPTMVEVFLKFGSLLSLAFS